MLQRPVSVACPQSALVVQPVCIASTMSKDSDTYVFITVLGQGVPWCERKLETTFDAFMHSAFGSTITRGRPSQGQDMEFSCAHPTSSGSNSLLKPASACVIKEAVQTSRIMLSLYEDSFCRRMQEISSPVCRKNTGLHRSFGWQSKCRRCIQFFLHLPTIALPSIGND